MKPVTQFRQRGADRAQCPRGAQSSTFGGDGNTRISTRETAARDWWNSVADPATLIRPFGGRAGEDGALPGEAIDLPRRQREPPGQCFRSMENDSSCKKAEASYSRRSTSWTESTGPG